MPAIWSSFASVDKEIRFPALVVDADEIADKADVVGPFGFAAQFQADLFGPVFTFLVVARCAGADQVFPGAFATSGARHDVIDRQLAIAAPTNPSP